MVEVGLTEPALYAGRDGAGLIGRPVRGCQRLRLGRQRVKGQSPDRLAGLDDHDTGLGPSRDRLRQRPEEVRVSAVGTGGRGCAHDHQVRLLCFAQDGVADVGSLAKHALATATEVLLDEGGEGTFRLCPDGHGDARWNEMEDHDCCLVIGRDGVGEAQREFGVRAATDRHQDALDVARAALLDDSDIRRRFADDLVDGRREDGRSAAATIGTGRRLAAPAEDDEVRLLLGGRLDDPLRGVPADPDDGLDGRPLRGVVEHLLEQPTGMTCPGRALGQWHAFRHLHDAQGGQLSVPGIQHRGAQPDQLLRGARVGDRDEDP